MVVVSHEMGFATSVASEIIFMEGGRIVEQGPPHILMSDPAYPRTRKFVSQFADLAGQRKE
jgi:polar amino acid transport system ATP-binding protein